MGQKRTYDEVVADIYEYIKRDKELASRLAETTGSVVYWYNMNQFNSLVGVLSPLDIVCRAWRGCDIGYDGQPCGVFNPSHKYFRFNYRGTIESSQWNDYSLFFDKNVILKIWNDDYLKYDLPSELNDLFEELQDCVQE